MALSRKSQSTTGKAAAPAAPPQRSVTRMEFNPVVPQQQPESPATSFKVQGSEAGELKIENDRLKTTIMILSNKLKGQNDSDQQIANLRKKVRECEE